MSSESLRLHQNQFYQILMEKKLADSDDNLGAITIYIVMCYLQ